MTHLNEQKMKYSQIVYIVIIFSHITTLITGFAKLLILAVICGQKVLLDGTTLISLFIKYLEVYLEHRIISTSKLIIQFVSSEH